MSTLEGEKGKKKLSEEEYINAFWKVGSIVFPRGGGGGVLYFSDQSIDNYVVLNSIFNPARVSERLNVVGQTSA
jgi:hypothetical protein